MLTIFAKVLQKVANSSTFDDPSLRFLNPTLQKLVEPQANFVHKIATDFPVPPKGTTSVSVKQGVALFDRTYVPPVLYGRLMRYIFGGLKELRQWVWSYDGREGQKLLFEKMVHYFNQLRDRSVQT